jgi:membrane protease YdiL (CAAX protease family)
MRNNPAAAETALIAACQQAVAQHPGVKSIIVGGAALTEELYFRGLLYGRLDARFGVASAVVGSAGLFGLVHFQPDAFPTLLALGLILGLVRMRSSSVWPGVGIHAANNVIAVVGLLLATQ